MTLLISEHSGIHPDSVMSRKLESGGLDKSLLYVAAENHWGQLRLEVLRELGEAPEQMQAILGQSVRLKVLKAVLMALFTQPPITLHWVENRLNLREPVENSLPTLPLRASHTHPYIGC